MSQRENRYISEKREYFLNQKLLICLAHNFAQIRCLFKHFTVHIEHGRKTPIANECELIARSGTCHLRPAKS